MDDSTRNKVVTIDEPTYVISPDTGNKVVVSEELVRVISVGMPGPPGGTLIGGKHVMTEGLSEGDLLEFDGNVWANRHKSTVTDGGNF